MADKKGILLLNIGSPVSYEVKDVKKYLNTFLMDKDVINLPFFVRWPLVHGIIVPKRAPFSAANYKKVWMEGEGSPLTVYTDRFCQGLQKDLGDHYLIKVGMRYSEPSIEKALNDFVAAGVKSLLLVPMFPQYAEATTGSSVKEVLKQIDKRGCNFSTKTLPAFFDAPAFIDPSVTIAKDCLKNKQIDHYLFSFHGLPESHVRKVEGCLVTSDCCLQKNACAKNCYRAQCFATAKAMADKLEIPVSHWSVSFQSRLGRAEWLKPATDHTLRVLGKSGKRNIAVLCPSFVADCIETLEEIGIGGQEIFHEAGGENFHLIPCVNEQKNWISGFAKMISHNSF